MSQNNEVKELFKTVVNGGYCIGCGACAVVDKSPIEVKFDPYLKLQAFVGDEDKDLKLDKSVLNVCPFSSKASNEDEIGKELFGTATEYNDKLGYVNATYSGYVSESVFRDNGSSGGMGTWILTELFTKGIVDNVIHVTENSSANSGNQKFQYKISNSIEDIEKGAKSRYYPIEISEVMKQVKGKAGKYVIVGIPCIIKAVRLLMKQDEVLNERIKLCVGLVCGHLKSGNFANMWAWQLGVHPSNLLSIDFRTKLSGFKASEYGITVTGKADGNIVTKKSPPVKQLFGADWGWGLFKYNACDYCDDVVGETADMTIGDAWLPEYVNDDKGTNIIVVRNEIINKVLNEAFKESRIYLDSIPIASVILSQNSGFKHRREGLSYRLYLKEKSGDWYPLKRVEATDKMISKKIKKRQEIRMELAKQSHLKFKLALEKNSIELFFDELRPLITRYNHLYKKGSFETVKNKIKSILKRI